VGAKADGFARVHGGKVMGSEIQRVRYCLNFFETMSLIVANTWFRKIDSQKLRMIQVVTGQWLTTYWPDCVVFRDIKVIRSEGCIPQHKLLVFVLKGPVSSMKKVGYFVNKCKISMLMRLISNIALCKVS